jgi:arylsulfatase A-like enzyme
MKFLIPPFVLLVAICTPAIAQDNILLIVVDDMREDARSITPNLDALARRSTVYTNAYVTGTSCLPSRTSLFTGLHPSDHGIDGPVRGFGPGHPAYDSVYDNPEIKVLPQIMHEGGYYTASTGKVLHAPVQSHWWDEFGPATRINGLYDPRDPTPDGTWFHYQVTTEPLQDAIVTDWATRFLNSYDKEQPFFLAVGLYLPHQPLYVPEWAVDLYPSPGFHVPTPGILDDEPLIVQERAHAPDFGTPYSRHELITNAGKNEDYTRGYLAAISHTDAMIGRLLAALEEAGLDSNTHIIMVSDHGYHLGEKYHWRKGTFWQEVVRTPMMISSPHYPLGEVSRAVTTLDLAPTVVDLAGIPQPEQFAGAPLHSSSTPVEIYSYNGRAQVINGWKVIDYDLDAEGIETMAAYWLELDPSESTNLIVPLMTATLKTRALAGKSPASGLPTAPAGAR